MAQRRKVIIPEGVPLPYPEFAPAVCYDHWIFASAHTAADYVSGLAAEARVNAGMPLMGEDERFREARHIFSTLERTFAAAGGSLNDCVRIDQFPTTRSIMDPYHTVRSETLSTPRPASTSVMVSGLLAPAAQIGVELIGLSGNAPFVKEAVIPADVPHSLFGIVPAVRAGDFVFVAAQVATDFKTGLAPEARRNPAFWQGSEIELETRYILKNVETVLRAAGSSLDNVVKAFIYLTEMRDIPRLDRVWREAFPKDPPARTIIPAAGIGVADTRIEINLVAVTNGGAARKEVIHPSDGKPALFHESRAVKAGNLLFLSGLMAITEEGLVDSARINPHNPHVTMSDQIQAEHIFDQADMICASAGCRLSDAVRMLSVHTDWRGWVSSKAAWGPRFRSGEPATTSIAVPGPLAAPGASVLFDLWVGT
ncbi:MAG: RidA family protein [Rhizobiaceae bacterium]